MVMQEVPNAEKLSTALERDMAAFAREKGMSLDALMEQEDALTKAALAEGKLRNGPSARDMERYISLRKLANAVRWPLSLVGVKPAHIPLNHAQLVDELLRVHGHEIFIDGFFNGDPHPGNLLLSYPDGKYGYSPAAKLAVSCSGVRAT